MTDRVRLVTTDYLDAIERREKLATKGPWFSVGHPWNDGAAYVNAGYEDPHLGRLVCTLDCQRDSETGEASTEANDLNDAEFIAHAREDIASLAASLRIFWRMFDELRKCVLPDERPSTVADYLAPIVLYLESRAHIEGDGKSENDEARVLCWLRDALAADQSDQLRRSEEILKTGATKAGDAVLELRRRNDELLDQLSAVLPDKVEAYINELLWSGAATEREKTLVAANLRAFAAAVRSGSPIPTEVEADDRT